MVNDTHSVWAKFVSDVVSPPVIWALMSFPIAARNAPSSSAALSWAVVYIVLVSAVPVLYILIQVRRGNITDMHMPDREERIRPFIVSAITATIAVIVLNQMNASSLMIIFTISSLIQIVLMALITTLWQISIHSVSVTGVAVTLGAMYGLIAGLIMIPVVVLVAVARLRLRRHTRAQVIAGIVVGGISVGLLLWVAGILVPSLWVRS
jgi:hypothetical protein